MVRYAVCYVWRWLVISSSYVPHEQEHRAVLDWWPALEWIKTLNSRTGKATVKRERGPKKKQGATPRDFVCLLALSVSPPCINRPQAWFVSNILNVNFFIPCVPNIFEVFIVFEPETTRMTIEMMDLRPYQVCIAKSFFGNPCSRLKLEPDSSAILAA